MIASTLIGLELDSVGLELVALQAPVPREGQKMFGFDVGIPVLLIGFSTIAVGSICLTVTWCRVIYVFLRTRRWTIPISLFLLSLAVLADLIAMFAMDSTPSSPVFFLSSWGGPC